MTESAAEWPDQVGQRASGGGRANLEEDVRDDVHAGSAGNYHANYSCITPFATTGNPPDELAIDVARTRLNTLLHCLPINW